MYVEQLYTGCLAEAAYYIESEGEAAIIDPIRETAPYISLAKSRGAKIKYIFETHFHADFISGHIDLARETGAPIIYGPGAVAGFPITVGKEGEVFSLGKINLVLIHTPGHTMESSCFLLKDENGKDHAIFSGDTLFVGDVGRPDLAIKAANKTQEDLAGILFESLNKIKPLADEVILYPGHGPGSACGKNLGSETVSTMGEQKRSNYALLIKDKAEFIKELCTGLPAPPAYFFEDAVMNRKGYESLDNILKTSSKPLSVTDFENEYQSGAIILDTRNAENFGSGFIPGSINLGLNGSFALWAGQLLDIKKPILIITDPGKEKEVIIRLSRVGYEKVIGYLENGIDSWKKSGKPMDTIESISAADFLSKKSQGFLVVDVRKFPETEKGLVEGAIVLPLDSLNSNWTQLDPDKKYLVHCAGGYRSMAACSILRKNGLKNLVNVSGGIAKIKGAGVPLVMPQLI